MPRRRLMPMYTIHNMLSLAQQIRDRAWQDYVQPALSRGDVTVSITAGDLVRSMALQNLTPTVCSALRSNIFQKQYHLRLESKEGPPSGNSTTMRFTYRLLDSKRPIPTESPIDRLVGIGETTYKQLGGGAAFIEQERAKFGKQ